MNYPSEYGKYILLESIGQGGMSAIDLAQTSVSDAQYVRFLVIKRMHAKFVEDPSFVRMFQDEARINAELQHANIAQVFDFGQENDEFYIAMEYIPGLDLRELQRALIQQQKSLPIRITLKIICEVLDALNYAHNRVDTYGRNMNIVHRDVNPRNVMLSVRGEIKLIDFGVAKSDTKIEQTVNKTLKGKFAYMSPEQFEGSKIDGRSDLFAVSLMLYEMIENKRPFAKLSEVQIMHRILSGRIPQMDGPSDHPHPALIQEVHRKALKTNPNDRYDNAQQMKDAIVEAAKEIGGIASTQEMAEYLRSVIPGRINTIADRLTQYREEITQNDGLSVAQLQEAFPPDDEETLAITGESYQNSQSYSQQHSVSTPPAPQKSYLGIVGFFVVALCIGVGAFIFLKQPPKPASQIVETPEIVYTNTATKTETVPAEVEEKQEETQAVVKTNTIRKTKTISQKQSTSTKIEANTQTNASTKPATETKIDTTTETKTETKVETKTEATVVREEIPCFIINLPKNTDSLSFSINGKQLSLERNHTCFAGENMFSLKNLNSGVSKTWSQSIVKTESKSKRITLPSEVF